MVDLSMRVNVILAYKFKHFYHDDFIKPSMSKKILGNIPEKEAFDKQRLKIYGLRTKNNSPEMRPCYEEPLLTREQEYHLFKKMNYLKFIASNMKEKIRPNRPNLSAILKIESIICNVISIRNQIANSNFRLASIILRKDYRRANDISTDASLSDAYFDVIKSVDYFNYTLGNKFSTYCVWVLRKNFYRVLNINKIKSDKYVSLDDTCDEFALESQDSSEYLDMHQRENAVFINNTIAKMKKSSRSNDILRQINIVEEYYGINGKNRKNLEEISRTLGITKERVRQLKEKFLSSMKSLIAVYGSEYAI